MTDFYKGICMVKCGSNSGTGFFINSSVLLTASHILTERLDDESLPIEIQFENSNYTQSVFPYSQEWRSEPIAILKSNDPLEGIHITALNHDLEENNAVKAYGFLANQEIGDSFQCSVSRKLTGSELKENCNTYLLTKDNHTNFEGLSGAPLFLNDKLTGMVLRQMLENGKAVRIEAITGHEFIEYIQLCGINIFTSSTMSNDSSDAPQKHIPLDSVYVKDGKLYVDDESLQLPEVLIPAKDIRPDELPYINALCAAYADALTQVVTPDIIDTLPGRYRKDFSAQRESYYEAEWLYHSVRDVFDGGEDKFNALKKDAYDGIESTYLKDYDNGFLRLQAVLEKITSTTLDTSSIIRLKNFVKNTHKKGICHILVNDGKINSWVDIDE